MGKRKHGLDEPENLKRFRGLVTKLAAGAEGLRTAHGGMYDQRTFQTTKKPMSKKMQRKEMRKLKKMRKNAYYECKPIPTVESLQKEKLQKENERKAKSKSAHKRKKQRNQRRRKQENKKKEEESRLDELRKATETDDREIKQCEKMLRLNKRKSKTISQGFKNDGLDFLLEAVDTDYLKSLAETGEDADLDHDLGLLGIKAEDVDGDSDTNDDDDDDDLSGIDESDTDSDFDEHCDEEQSADVKKSALIEHIIRGLKQSQKPESKNVTFADDVTQGDVSSGEESNDDVPEASDDDDDDDDDDSDDESTGDYDSAGEEPEEDSNQEESEDQGGEEEEIKTDICPDADHDRSVDDTNKRVENKTEGLEEDIYGRLRKKDGTVVASGGSYIPPGKRLAMAKDQDEKQRLLNERLKKQLKGLMNRLSESNMQSISSQIEQLFLSHTRAEMCAVLTEVVLSACVAPSVIPERLITEHTMLLAILHNNIGTQIGASFLQTLAQKYDSLCRDTECYNNSKEIDNLLVLLSVLYNFKIAHCQLLFDVMKQLADRFKEKDIELLLIILRNVGFGLRKDDPLALKEFIIMIQGKAAASDTTEFQDKSRVRFMLETIMHIRNNNVRKIPNYDPSHMEHLKKLMRNYVTGSAGGELRISLSELLDAEHRGRWWLVGSAWHGDQQSTDDAAISTPAVLHGVSSRILELARKQRMNTDTRRTIFCLIMSSEDYVDAFEKLLRLGLKNQEERDIIHVIMDVCLQEKQFNAFYAYLAQKFCEYDRRFQMTLQFNVWDKFKQLSSWKPTRIANLACLLTHLLATKALSISVFKVIEFSELDRWKVRLMKLTLQKLLLDYTASVSDDVFSRVAGIDKLSSLRDGLVLFMRHFLRGKKSAKGEEDVKGTALAEAVSRAETALGAHDGRMCM